MYPYDGKKHLFITSDEHYKFASDIIEKGSTVLDVGCGAGELLKWLPEVNYTGIDATKWAVTQANDPRITYCDLMEYNYTNYDYVVCFGVIDTVIDLQPLADKLKTFGDVILFSYNEGICNPDGKFKKHKREDVIKAFGEIECYQGYETYCIWRR